MSFDKNNYEEMRKNSESKLSSKEKLSKIFKNVFHLSCSAQAHPADYLAVSNKCFSVKQNFQKKVR